MGPGNRSKPESRWTHRQTSRTSSGPKGANLILFSVSAKPAGGSEPGTSGGIAQLGEHKLCKLGVTGSSPVASTRLRSEQRGE